MKNPFKQARDSISGNYRSKLREKAIIQAKKSIALSDKKIEDFTAEELEFIVLAEEEKVKGTIRNTGLAALLILLGLS